MSKKAKKGFAALYEAARKGDLTMSTLTPTRAEQAVIDRRKTLAREELQRVGTRAFRAPQKSLRERALEEENSRLREQLESRNYMEQLRRSEEYMAQHREPDDEPDTGFAQAYDRAQESGGPRRFSDGWGDAPEPGPTASQVPPVMPLPYRKIRMGE